MGNVKSQSALEILDYHNPAQWKLRSNLKYCQIIININTAQQAQQYTLKLQSNKQLQDEYYIYQSRRNKNHIVEVYNVQKIKQQFSCSGSIMLKIRLQRIPYRLSDIQNLNQREALYVLKSTLIGFKIIQQTIGSVRVNQNMIGFNTKGVVKVWLNEHLEKNHPQQGFNLKMMAQQASIAKKNQQNMVKQIFKQVEDHIIGLKYPNKFIQRFKQEKVINFFQSINFIDDYCEEQTIQLPKYIQFTPFHLKKITQPEILNQSIYHENQYTKNNSNIYQLSNNIKTSTNSVYISNSYPFQLSQNTSSHSFDYQLQNHQQPKNKANTLNTITIPFQNKQNNLRYQKITTVRKLMTQRSLNKEHPCYEKRQNRIISTHNNFMQHKPIHNLDKKLNGQFPQLIYIKSEKHSANSNSIQLQEPNTNYIEMQTGTTNNINKVYTNPFVVQKYNTNVNKYIKIDQNQQNNGKNIVKIGESFQKIKKNGNGELQMNQLMISKNQDFTKYSTGLKGINLQSKTINKNYENNVNIPIRFHVQNSGQTENKKIIDNKNAMFRYENLHK